MYIRNEMKYIHDMHLKFIHMMKRYHTFTRNDVMVNVVDMYFYNINGYSAAFLNRLQIRL